MMTTSEVRVATSNLVQEMEILATPWPDATQALRKSRRPHGWVTTPKGLLKRAQQGDQEAVSSLCGKYWQLVQSYLSGRGATRAQADDATQGCFERLLKRQDLFKLELSPADSFGSWLASRAWYFLRNQWKQEKKQRALLTDTRPGRPRVEVEGQEHDTPESRLAERRVLLLFALQTQYEQQQHHKMPDRRLEEGRALELVERAFARLRPEYERLGRVRLFDHLKTTLLEEEVDTDPTDAELCGQLGYRRCDIANARRRVLRVEIPAAILTLHNEDRAPNPNGPGPKAPIPSPREELRAHADVVAA